MELSIDVNIPAACKSEIDNPPVPRPLAIINVTLDLTIISFPPFYSSRRSIKKNTSSAPFRDISVFVTNQLLNYCKIVPSFITGEGINWLEKY